MFQRLMDPAQHTPRKEAPTLRAFAPRFMDGHARANRQKPSGIAAKEVILRVHLEPALGHRKLDAIKSEDVQCLKRDLEVKAPKTVRAGRRSFRIWTARDIERLRENKAKSYRKGRGRTPKTE